MKKQKQTMKQNLKGQPLNKLYKIHTITMEHF